MTPFDSPLFAVPHAGLIGIGGPDAPAFLQAQLSRRIDDLTPEFSALAGWHDARGRVRAVFRVLVTHSGYLLIGPGGLTADLHAALRMYVLRSRVTLEIAPLVCGGILAGQSAEQASHRPGLPPLPGARDAVATAGSITAVCVAPGCWYLIGTAEDLQVAPAPDSSPIAAAEIRAGLPQVDARTTARYVPHMLNLDRLGALDFHKGCYPGQEVIARTEHLGAVKRRACGFTCRGVAIPDSETPVLDARHEVVGTVLRAAGEDDGTIVLLAVVALDALGQSLFLGAPDGPQLGRLALPFE